MFAILFFSKILALWLPCKFAIKKSHVIYVCICEGADDETNKSNAALAWWPLYFLLILFSKFFGKMDILTLKNQRLKLFIFARTFHFKGDTQGCWMLESVVQVIAIVRSRSGVENSGLVTAGREGSLKLTSWWLFRPLLPTFTCAASRTNSVTYVGSCAPKCLSWGLQWYNFSSVKAVSENRCSSFLPMSACVSSSVERDCKRAPVTGNRVLQWQP